MELMEGYVVRTIFTLIYLFFLELSLAQQVDVIKANQLFEMVENCDTNSNIQVYNFWATWCAPCIRELPQFETINEKYSNIDVTLISVDDVDLLASKVIPFLKKRGINSRVMLLDEVDFNDIIDRIDKNWSGAIPITLIVDCSKNKRYFYEKAFEENELDETIKEIINQL